MCVRGSGMQNTKRNMPLKHRGLVTFLAIRDKVQERLDKGWFLVDVYEAYVDALGVSYSQFARYVATHIRGKESKTQQRAKGSAPQSRSDTAAQPNTEAVQKSTKGPIITSSNKPKRFIFDPTAAHRRKDELF